MRGIVAAGEGGAAAQRPRALAPRQQIEAVGAHAFEQGRLDRGRDRRGCPGRPKAGSRRAGGRARRGPLPVAGSKATSVPLGDAVGEQGFDRRLVDRRGGEDARAGGGAADLGDREPGLARERRGGIEPEAAAADADPVCAGGVAALRDAVGKGESDAGADLARSRSPERAGAAAASLRARPARGLGAPAFLAAPAPQAQLQVGVVAAEAALGEEHRDLGRGLGPAARLRPRSAYGRGAAAAAARRWRGRAAVGRPPSSSAPSAEQALARLVDRGGGRRIEPAQLARIGDAPDRAIEQQARDRSASRISGGSKRGRLCGRRLLPEAVDPARPLPAGAAGALGDRGLAGALGDQPGEAGGAVVARAAGEAGIDDDADPVEGQAGLGDRGGEDELAAARRRRRRSRRAGRRDRGCRGGGGDRRRRAGASSRSAVRSISATPGRKASRLPSLSPSARRIAGGHLVLDPLLGGAAEMDRARSDGRGPRFRSPARRPSARRSGRRRASPTWRAGAGRGAARPARRAPARGRNRCRGCARGPRRTAPPRRRPARDRPGCA